MKSGVYTLVHPSHVADVFGPQEAQETQQTTVQEPHAEKEI